MSLKILFLSHQFHPDVGGIEVNSEILANAFHQAGHTVRLLTWSGEREEKKRFPFLVKRKPNVWTLFREHAWADVIYENNPCLRLSWPSVFFYKPVVIALRTWVSRNDGTISWKDRMKLRRLNNARSVIAVSDSVRRRCYPAATVIGNPYRADIFKQSAGIARNYNFAFLGRLVSDKGADLAIQALHQVLIEKASSKSLRDDYSLTIIGDGPERKTLEGLVNRLGIRSRVSFCGTLLGSALVACLNRHRYILVPSLWEEPFGNVALEGMACGCVPIVSDGGGLPDAVGNAGLVFSRGNVSSLTSCMRKLIDDESLEIRLRAAAPYQLAAHHPQTIARKYLDVIESAKH